MLYGRYGSRFHRWLQEESKEPIGSYGNGSAMRVSACGWAAHSLQEAEHLARLSAEVTHNHPEGIKGAMATSAAVYMAITGSIAEAYYGIPEEIERRASGFLDDRLNSVVQELRKRYSEGALHKKE